MRIVGWLYALGASRWRVGAGLEWTDQYRHCQRMARSPPLGPFGRLVLHKGTTLRPGMQLGSLSGCTGSLSNCVGGAAT